MKLVDCPAVVGVRVTAPLRHLCPHVEEVDDGTVTIAWTTSGKTIELHSLKAWLATFADRKISHEEITERIELELAGLGFRSATVTTSWDTAGMEVSCSTSRTPAAPGS